MAYESRLRLLGLPLVHITTGRIEDGRTGAASPSVEAGRHVARNGELLCRATE